MLEFIDSVSGGLPLILAGIALIVWAVRVEGMGKSNQKEAIEAKVLALSVQKELSSFRERAGIEYVTAPMMASMRNEITIELRRLSDRLDRWLEKERT